MTAHIDPEYFLFQKESCFVVVIGDVRKRAHIGDILVTSVRSIVQVKERHLSLNLSPLNVHKGIHDALEGFKALLSVGRYLRKRARLDHRFDRILGNLGSRDPAKEITVIGKVPAEGADVCDSRNDRITYSLDRSQRESDASVFGLEKSRALIHIGRKDLNTELPCGKEVPAELSDISYFG